MKGFPNIQNRDNEYLIMNAQSCLNPGKRNPTKIRDVDREFTKHLNFNPIQDGSF